MATDVSDMKRSYRTPVSGEFPENLNIPLRMDPSLQLRYGENPMQPAAVYQVYESRLADITNVRLAKTGKGGISAINLMDVLRAMDTLKYFDSPAVCVMKHNIPSGFARQSLYLPESDLVTHYINARDADARSAFGSVVVFNRAVDRNTASELLRTYVEGVAAPEYEPGAIEILEQKKDLRVLLFSGLDRLPKYNGDDTEGLYDMKALPTGRLIVQKPYLTSIRSPSDLVLDGMVKEKDGKEHKLVRMPANCELEDMLTSWYVNFGVRSNGIVLVKEGVTLAIGSGQQERVGAVEQCIVKAYQKAADRAGLTYNHLFGIAEIVGKIPEPLFAAACSSDAFFPNRDSIDTLAQVLVGSIVQPGGSIKDHEIIDAVNQHGMIMAFTLERCFGHF